jgi:hypothetical protein
VALRGGGCDHLPTPSTSRASLGVRIELFGWLLFFGKSVSFCSLQFIQGDWMCCYFPQTMAGLPTQAGSTQHLAVLKVKFFLRLFGHEFCPGGVQFTTWCIGLCGSLQNRW